MLKNSYMTGCDKNTEWQLPWFLENLRKYNDEPLIIADFGMSPEMCTYASVNCDIIIDMSDKQVSMGRKNWMKKPKSMASTVAENTIWLDTDCQVLGNLSEVFKLIKPNKLLMAEDRPWTKRRGNKWHNSGVVGFYRVPDILKQWAIMVEKKGNIEGDQEVLHWMMGDDALRRMSYIEDLPPKYNTLRLDLLDKTQPKDIMVMHWTGQKGNEKIRNMIRG